MKVMHRPVLTLLVFVLLAAAGFAQAPDFAETKKKAEGGHAGAQCLLGEKYLNGNGVPKDDDEAVKWFRKAADQGNTIAQYNLKGPARGGEARKRAAIEQAAASKQAAKDRYAKSTDRAVKLVIKGLAIGMSIDAALEVVNERLSGVLNQKYEIKRSESSQDTSGAYLSPVSDSSPQKINEGNGGLLMLSLLSGLENSIGTSIGLPLSFSIECEVNNDAVTRIVLPAKLTNALFNTADMQASDFLLQIRQNYGVGVKAGDWTVFQFYKAETNWTGWEYSSPEGYRIRVFDDKAIEMKKIPKSNERSFN